MEFSEVFEFYENEYTKDKYVRCNKTKNELKKMFPNIRYVFVMFNNFEKQKTKVVSCDGFLDIGSTNIIIVTNEGKCISIGSSEWGHIQEEDPSKFIMKDKK